MPPTLAAWVNKQCKIIQKFHGAHSDKAADKPPDRVNNGRRRVCRESKVGVNHTPLSPLSPCFPGSDPGPCAPISKFLSFRLLNHYEMSLSIRGNVLPSLPPPPPFHYLATIVGGYCGCASSTQLSLRAAFYGYMDIVATVACLIGIANQLRVPPSLQQSIDRTSYNIRTHFRSNWCVVSHLPFRVDN